MTQSSAMVAAATGAKSRWRAWRSVAPAVVVAVASGALATSSAAAPAPTGRGAFVVVDGVDDASEVVRGSPRRPSTTARALRLGRGVVSGIRVRGVVGEPEGGTGGASVASSVLRLGVVRGPHRESVFHLRIGVGFPNEPEFSRDQRGDVSRRALLGEVEVAILLKPGATSIEIPNVLNQWLDEARSATRDGVPAWVPGAENTLTLLLSSGDMPRAVRLGSVESGQPASLAVCLGSCALEDADHDGRLVVACVGDSNTALPNDWCTPLAELGAAHGWLGYVGGAGGSASGSAVVHADVVIARVAAELGGARPDVILFAYGTNDVSAYWDPPYGNGTYALVLDRLAAAKSHVESLGIRFGLALAPPVRLIPGGFAGNPVICTELHQSRTDGFNLGAAERFRSQAFGFVPAVSTETGVDFQPFDCLHLSAAGRLKRAQAAFAALSGG